MTRDKSVAIFAAILFAFTVAACSSSDNQMTTEPTEPTEPTDPTEPTPGEQQMAELRAQIAELREQLGLSPDDDVDATLAELQSRVDTLTTQLEEQEAAEAAAAEAARVAQLREFLKNVPTAATGTDRRRASNARAKPDDATDLDDPTAISSWNGASWSIANADDSTTTAVVYDNRGPGTQVAFSQKWANNDDATPANRDGVYALTASTDAEFVSLAGLPTNPNHKPLVVGPVQGLRGSFDGVPGTFKGTGATGTNVGLGVDGNPVWNGTDLSFTPDDGTSTVNRPDAAYMSLGYWVTEAENGAITQHVAGWTSGPLYATDDMQPLIGKATFNGIAVGHYTVSTVDSIDGGHFNADAKLEVDFGTDLQLVAGLTGVIDGFMREGEPLGSDWKVELTGGTYSVDRTPPRVRTGGTTKGTFGSQHDVRFLGGLL